jgi:hypothetical protein
MANETEVAVYNVQAVVPSVAWDFLFDKHLPYLTYLT